MKKAFFIFSAGLFLSAVPFSKVLAEASDLRTPPGWYLGVGLGVDAPVQNWDPSFLLGGGGDCVVGYRFDPSLSLQLTLNPWMFTSPVESILDLRSSLELKLTNPSPGWSAYLLAGPGYDFQSITTSNYTTSSLAAVVGLGFQFDFRPGEHAFIEGRYDFLIYNNETQQDVPVLAGLIEDL